MRLLQINTVINSGSTGRIAEEIGLRIIEKGGESFIAFGRKTERPSKSHKIQIGNKQDIFLHGIGTRLTDRHAFFSKIATEKLILQIIKANPDIIHLHNIHGYYLNIEILFNYLSNVKTPIVWTLHDCWPITGHCTHFSYINCEKWKTHCEKCPQKKEYPASYWLDNSFKNFQRKKGLFTSINNMTIVPVSNWLAQIIRESFLNKYPFKVIHNGIDTEVFKPQDTSNLCKRYQIQDKFVLLGVASVWNQRKGFQDFMELNNLLSDDEIIIMVGLNKQQIKSLPQNMIGIERTENISHLVELYSLADIVLNLSFEETFGLTTIEGFACGTPGIVYNCTASPELMSSKTGFVVEQSDLMGVRRAMDEIKKNGKGYYTHLCREKAVNQFDKSLRYDEYIKLYDELLKEN
ncbi:Glycosyl transferases group 1 [anaerobic digester metagenome]